MKLIDSAKGFVKSISNILCDIFSASSVKDVRTRKKLQDFAIPTLLSEKPHTVSSAIVEQGGAASNWCTWYRIFSEGKWDVESVFEALLEKALGFIPKNGAVVLGADDSILRKTSLYTGNTAYARDPVGVKFRTNLVVAQRFLEFSVIVRSRNGTVMRAVPVSFEMIPPKTASEKRLEKQDKMLKKVLDEAKAELEQCVDADERLQVSLLMTLVRGLMNKKIPLADVELLQSRAAAEPTDLREMLEACGARLSDAVNGRLLSREEIAEASGGLFAVLMNQMWEDRDFRGAETENIEAAKTRTVSEIARDRCVKLCRAIKKIRPDLKIVVIADGGFANSTFLCGKGEADELPQDVSILVRCRKDSKFRKRIYKNGEPGYGDALPSPEQLLSDRGIEAKTELVSTQGRKKKRKVRIKCVKDICWQRVTRKGKGNLICVGSEHYNMNKRGRRSKSSEMYLFVLGEMPEAKLAVQWYLLRWDMEVGFRDQKFELGMGKAQVHNKLSIERHPAYVACCYSAMLLASMESFNGECPEGFEGPKWDKNFKNRRLSVRSMLRIIKMAENDVVNASNVA